MSEQGDVLDPRVAELLSADLDGAVSAEEHDLAEQWLAASPQARAERESLAAVKAALSSLPDVEPPAGFFESMLAHGSPRPEPAVAVAPVVSLASRRRALPAAAAAAAAVAAAWVVVAGGGAAAVAPPVDDVEAALGATSLVGDSSTAGDVDLVRVDGGRVAVLRQRGDDVAWDELPTGRRGEEDGADTWIDLTTDEGLARVVVARGDEVHTLVSVEVDADELIEAGVDGLPEEADGIVDRLRRACDNLLGAFSGD